MIKVADSVAPDHDRPEVAVAVGEAAVVVDAVVAAENVNQEKRKKTLHKNNSIEKWTSI